MTNTLNISYLSTVLKYFLLIKLISPLEVVGEKPIERLEESFNLLNETCQTSVLTNEHCHAKGLHFEDLDSKEYLSSFCLEIDSVQQCLNTHLDVSCTTAEISVFVERLCFFVSEEITKRMNGFTPGCRSGFQTCLNEKAKYMFDQEDYCKAFKEDGDLETCFLEIRECTQRHQNFKIFRKSLRRYACASVPKSHSNSEEEYEPAKKSGPKLSEQNIPENSERLEFSLETTSVMSTTTTKDVEKEVMVGEVGEIQEEEGQMEVKEAVIEVILPRSQPSEGGATPDKRDRTQMDSHSFSQEIKCNLILLLTCAIVSFIYFS